MLLQKLKLIVKFEKEIDSIFIKIHINSFVSAVILIIWPSSFNFISKLFSVMIELFVKTI